MIGLGLNIWTPTRVGSSLTAQVQALFAGGKVGGMWDMGDTSTLYQQHINGGTTFNVVTAAGQQIGAALDKSKQSAWTVNTGSTWTKNSGDGVVTVVGNVITITGATTTTRVDRVGGTIPFAPGVAQINVTASWSVATGPAVWCRGSVTTPPNGSATTLTSALNNSSLERVQIDSGTATFTINSLKYWKGNNATQSIPGSRPLYQVVGGYGCAQFDATDDALLFPAITFGGAFNTFVAGKVTGGTSGIHLWRTADSGGGYWGVYQSGSALSATAAAVGSPSYFKDGAPISPETRGQIYTLINGVDSVLESIGVVLSAETALQFSGYGVGFNFQGNAHRVLMISGTLTAAEKLLCRRWAAEGNGVAVV